MAVKLKLTRMGSKKRPFYRVVAANNETRRDAPPPQLLAHHTAMTAPADTQLDMEKVNAWIARGAEATDTVRALIRKQA